MNPNNNNEMVSTLPNDPLVKQRHPVNQITLVSKYLALALFVMLPFIGAYVGYQLAPEKVMEVPVVITEINKTESINSFTASSSNELSKQKSEFCPELSLYGFSYYQSNIDSSYICFENELLLEGNVDTLKPLDSEIDGYLSDVVVPSGSSQYAFDKTSFYADGIVIYSVEKNDFSFIKDIDASNKVGEIEIAGKNYIFKNTGLIGVILTSN